jgi:MFS family permease
MGIREAVAIAIVVGLLAGLLVLNRLIFGPYTSRSNEPTTRRAELRDLLLDLFDEPLLICGALAALAGLAAVLVVVIGASVAIWLTAIPAAFALAAREMARRRGRSVYGWMLAGALLGPFATLVLLFLPAKAPADPRIPTWFGE